MCLSIRLKIGLYAKSDILVNSTFVVVSIMLEEIFFPVCESTAIERSFVLSCNFIDVSQCLRRHWFNN